MSELEFNHDALVDKTNALLDEVERVGDSWHSGKDSTESLRQLRILASGYIQSLEQAVASMGECVNEVLDENERLNHANGEIAGAAKVMEELARELVDKKIEQLQAVKDYGYNIAMPDDLFSHLTQELDYGF